MGIQWRIWYRLCWISNVIPNFKSHNIIMSARVYAKKRVKDCKDVSVMSPQDEHWRQKVYSVCILYTLIQSKHKQTKCEHSRQTLTDYSFLSRYHYTKTKNYLKRRYRIRHWIPMFIETPCTKLFKKRKFAWFYINRFKSFLTFSKVF